LSIQNFEPSDLGYYICKSRNKNGKLVGTGFKFDLDGKENVIVTEIEEQEIGADGKMKIHFAEKQNPPFASKYALSSNIVDVLPNIRITFMDKFALSKNERVQIRCLTGNCS
jgi:hypothetical protein